MTNRSELPTYRDVEIDVNVAEFLVLSLVALLDLVAGGCPDLDWDGAVNVLIVVNALTLVRCCLGESFPAVLLLGRVVAVGEGVALEADVQTGLNVVLLALELCA